MIEFALRGFAAWAPGLGDLAAWRHWAVAPTAPALDGAPELKFVPAMQRRRFTRLTRMALQVAFDATPRELLPHVRSVFASRHGEADTCIALLSDIARELPLSPTQFSHSVHNSQSGLFSITAQNGAASSAIAAGSDTFCAGLVEALCQHERDARLPVLLVVADEPMPSIYARFEDEIPVAYALALLIETAATPGSARYGLEFGAHAPCSDDLVRGAAAAHSRGYHREPVARAARHERRLPQALEFFAWMLAGDAQLELGRAGKQRTLHRLDPGSATLEVARGAPRDS